MEEMAGKYLSCSFTQQESRVLNTSASRARRVDLNPLHLNPLQGKGRPHQGSTPTWEGHPGMGPSQIGPTQGSRPAQVGPTPRERVGHREARSSAVVGPASGGPHPRWQDLPPLEVGASFGRNFSMGPTLEGMHPAVADTNTGSLRRMCQHEKLYLRVQTQHSVPSCHTRFRRKQNRTHTLN